MKPNTKDVAFKTRPKKHSLYAVCPLGFEQVCAQELKSIGVKKLTVRPGGVSFQGSNDMLMRANLWLRTASRVLCVLHEQRVTTFSGLINTVAQVDWDKYVAPDDPIKVQVSCKKSRLYHDVAVADRVYGVLGPRSGDGPEQQIWVQINRDSLTLSVDTSGDLLHKRGYRVAEGTAPMRENLAAGCLLAAQWDPNVPLIDPMCGSGTFLIEAAHIAMKRAPGIERHFAFERWPGFNAKGLQHMKEAAHTSERSDVPTIIGCDVDTKALRAAQLNAEEAGVEIQLERLNARNIPRPEGPAGMVIANPPYGRRIKGARGAMQTLVALGTEFGDWNMGLIAYGKSRMPENYKQLVSFKNGGIPVRLMARSNEKTDE